jgi:predicted RNA binding protein YcfA (HicA-like mRNA interferase family)
MIPIHSGQDIGRGLLRKILKDIEMPPDEFKELL